MTENPQDNVNDVSHETVETEVTDGADVSRETSVNEDRTDTTETEQDDQDTFTRSYVEKLRRENAKWRERAQTADELAHRLHRALVEQDGRLVNAEELPFSYDHLDDADVLSAAIGELVDAKPYLRARPVPTGDIGQGARGDADGDKFDLIKAIRGY